MSDKAYNHEYWTNNFLQITSTSVLFIPNGSIVYFKYCKQAGDPTQFLFKIDYAPVTEKKAPVIILTEIVSPTEASSQHKRLEVSLYDLDDTSETCFSNGYMLFVEKEFFQTIPRLTERDVEKILYREPDPASLPDTLKFVEENNLVSVKKRKLIPPLHSDRAIVYVSSHGACPILLADENENINMEDFESKLFQLPEDMKVTQYTLEKGITNLSISTPIILPIEWLSAIHQNAHDIMSGNISSLLEVANSQYERFENRPEIKLSKNAAVFGHHFMRDFFSKPNVFNGNDKIWNKHFQTDLTDNPAIINEFVYALHLPPIERVSYFASKDIVKGNSRKPRFDIGGKFIFAIFENGTHEIIFPRMAEEITPATPETEVANSIREITLAEILTNLYARGFKDITIVDRGCSTFKFPDNIRAIMNNSQEIESQVNQQRTRFENMYKRHGKKFGGKKTRKASRSKRRNRRLTTSQRKFH